MEVFMDACKTGISAIYQPEVYHTEFLPQVLAKQHPIIHLEALNALVALRRWAPQLTDDLIQLYSDSTTAVTIFQVSRGREVFI